MHVVESFCGGVFTSVTQIINHLNPENFDASLVYSLRPETPSNFREFIRPDVQLIALPMTREIKPIEDLGTLARLMRLFSKERPDVVHLHSSKAGVLGRLAARLAKVPAVLYSPRGFAFLRQDVGASKQAQYRLFEHMAARFGGTVIACSMGELEAARQVARRTTLLNNAIDVDAIDSIVRPDSSANVKRADEITVAIAGRIVPQKAPALFAELARRVTAARPGGVKFVWIGSGENVRELAHAPIEVTGWLPREDVLKTIHNKVDIYLHTSLWEGMPLAILEAMALRKPIVATDCIGNSDVVAHGQTGFLGATPDELTHGLLRLVDDARWRDKMGMAGRARAVAEFSLPLLIRNISNLYQATYDLSRAPPASI